MSQTSPVSKNKLSRRDALAMTAGTLTLAGATRPAAAKEDARRRVLRFAHLTDLHVQPEKGAVEGMAACLHHVQSLADPPELILTGGDLIMDSFEQGHARTELLWSLWTKTLKDECSLHVEHCIGNHDVWGWNTEKSMAKPTDIGYGKQWAQDVLQLPGRFRSFDRAGWHFIVLDSTHEGAKPGSYVAMLDAEQFTWLEADLKATPPSMPVLVLSHIPILAACVFFDGENEKTGDWVVPGSWMHLDSRILKDLFSAYPNVKLCLSGHIHLIDRVEYHHVTYLCNGAVCGNWWKGDYHECDEGYALVDLYDDGSFESSYSPYGWNVVLP